MLSEDTLVSHGAPPRKGKFWDFGIIAVGTTDDMGYRFPNKAAAVMLLDRYEALNLPDGVMVHRLLGRIEQPFIRDITVAVQADMVTVVIKELILLH